MFSSIKRAIQVHFQTYLQINLCEILSGQYFIAIHADYSNLSRNRVILWHITSPYSSISDAYVEMYITIQVYCDIWAKCRLYVSPDWRWTTPPAVRLVMSASSQQSTDLVTSVKCSHLNNGVPFARPCLRIHGHLDTLVTIKDCICWPDSLNKNFSGRMPAI